MFDLLIRNATIVDGSGRQPWNGHLAVTDGRIAELSDRDELAAAPAAEVVDAEKVILAPGFIDLHSHADFPVQGAPAAETQLMQGVTTVVTGNCGASTFPTRSIEMLQRASAQFDAVFDGEWADAHGYARTTRAHHPGVNIVMQVGHTTVRAHVVGMDQRVATNNEIAAMQKEIRKAADQGVRGFSSGLIYAPGSFADAHEMQALVTTAAEFGLLYSTHLRNESDHLLDAVDEAITTAKLAGARLEISHLKAMGPANHGLALRALERIDFAEASGLDVAADVYPYTASSTTLTSRLPGYALDGGADALMLRLADNVGRSQIAGDLAARFGRDIDPDGVIIAAVGPAVGDVDLSAHAGQSLVQLGDALGCSPQDAALQILAAHGGAVAIVNHAMDEGEVADIIAHPRVSIASDGWTLSLEGSGVPHPRSFGTFARVLGKYVREQKLLTLEEAIRKMTALPASRIGLKDRGRLERGHVADLVLFDEARIADVATYMQPRALATGVSDVWLAGNRSVRDGSVTPARHGTVL